MKTKIRREVQDIPQYDKETVCHLAYFYGFIVPRWVSFMLSGFVDTGDMEASLSPVWSVDRQCIEPVKSVPWRCLPCSCWPALLFLATGYSIRSRETLSFLFWLVTGKSRALRHYSLDSLVIQEPNALLIILLEDRFAISAFLFRLCVRTISQRRISSSGTQGFYGGY